MNMMVKVNPGTGQKHFLVEVEDGEIESTDAGNGSDNDAGNGSDNGAVGSEEEEDGGGRTSGQASQAYILLRQNS